MEQHDMKLTFALLLAVAIFCQPAHAQAEQEIIVSAAASLRDAFLETGKSFEKENPGTRVIFNFGASGALVQQIAGGAPVDVFASADEASMDLAEKKALILKSSRRDFARNSLVLIVPVASALDIKGLKSLTGNSVARIAVGTPDTVPAGRYAKDILTENGSWDLLEKKFIYTNNVRQALDYVSRNEVDAGFVYASDAVVAKGKVRVVSVLNGKRPAVYPIALTAASRQGGPGEKFIEFVLGKGEAPLLKYGFMRP
jgi:molybdate transport system substrate-binding protein